MKRKVYMQPDVAILEMELEQMVAASDGYVDVDDGTSDNPENADSRLFFESDDVLQEHFLLLGEGEIDVNLRAERKFLAIYLLNSGKSVTFAPVKQKREDRC